MKSYLNIGFNVIDYLLGCSSTTYKCMTVKNWIPTYIREEHELYKNENSVRATVVFMESNKLAELIIGYSTL